LEGGIGHFHAGSDCDENGDEVGADLGCAFSQTTIYSDQNQSILPFSRHFLPYYYIFLLFYPFLAIFLP